MLSLGQTSMIRLLQLAVTMSLTARPEMTFWKQVPVMTHLSAEPGMTFYAVAKEMMSTGLRGVTVLTRLKT